MNLGVPVPPRRRDRVQGGRLFRRGEQLGAGVLALQRPGGVAAYGVGVRWYSPMGPLRFEVGMEPRRPEGQPRRVMEFTIGTAF